MEGFSARCPLRSGSGPHTGRAAGDGVPGPAAARVLVFVAKAVSRLPFTSVNRSCAPGCGRSARTMTRIPSGQSDRSSSPVSSVTQAPSLGFRSALYAGVHADCGISSSFAHRGVVQAEPDGVLQALSGQPSQELVGAAGTVGADQDLPSWPPTRGGGRQLGQCGFGDVDVIDRGIRSGVAFAEDHRDGFPGATITVIDPGADRVMIQNPACSLHQAVSGPLSVCDRPSALVSRSVWWLCLRCFGMWGGRAGCRLLMRVGRVGRVSGGRR